MYDVDVDTAPPLNRDSVLTIVDDQGGTWVIAIEDYELPDSEWSVLDENFDSHLECDGSLEEGMNSGRPYCRCGYWYERNLLVQLGLL